MGVPRIIAAVLAIIMAISGTVVFVDFITTAYLGNFADLLFHPFPGAAISAASR